ncbi:MAG: TrbI/VirB10 family protein [Betaproteobacteria bacterium]|nr:TrbI/VirB10 family protein [Betaproteobacteria bacterium]
MSGAWEESDQAYPTHSTGKVRRNLHWLVAGGLGLGVIVGFAIQGSLFSKVDAHPGPQSSPEDNPVVLGQEPSMSGLRQELVRQQVGEVVSEPAHKINEVEQESRHIQRLESEKRDALVAGSRMLAINRSPDAIPSPSTAMPVISPPTVRDALPTEPTGIAESLSKRLPVDLAMRDNFKVRSGNSQETVVPTKLSRAQTPLIPVKPTSQRQVLEGSLIPAVLLTQVNSDLPGMLTAQVTEDVYDSIHGNFLAIPKGSRVIGEYNAHVVIGQERIMAMFHRLILPGGESFNLDDMQAADRAGQSGMKDEVDNRFWTRLGGQFMTAGLARIISPPEGGVTILGGAGNTLAGDAAGQILVDTARVGFSGNAALGPVIVIKRGYPFVIMVNRDMDFSTLIARAH